MQKLIYHVKIEQKNGAGFVKIPFDLFSIRIPSKDGGLHLLKNSEIYILAFLMQCNGEINLDDVAIKFNISIQTVRRSLKMLEGAGLVENLN